MENESSGESFYQKKEWQRSSALTCYTLCRRRAKQYIVWASRSFCAKNEIRSRNLRFISMEVQSWFMSIFSFVTVRRAVCISSDYSKCRSSWNSLSAALFNADIQSCALKHPVLEQVPSSKFSLKNWQVFAKETWSPQNCFITFLRKPWEREEMPFLPTRFPLFLTDEELEPQRRKVNNMNNYEEDYFLLENKHIGSSFGLH